MSNNPIRYNDPTGHMQACDGGDLCGKIGTSDHVYERFKASPFAFYYLALSHAERDIHKYHSNPTDENKIIMESSVSFARLQKALDLSTVDQDKLTDAMFVYPDIIGGGYVEVENDLGIDGSGGSVVDPGATPMLPYQSPTPTPTKTPSPTLTPTPTIAPTITRKPTLKKILAI